MSDANYDPALRNIFWPIMRTYKELADAYELLVSIYDDGLDRALRGEKLEEIEVRQLKALRRLHVQVFDELKFVKS